MKTQIRLSRKTTIILVCILLLQVIVCIYYGTLKKGFFVDEWGGAGLANCYYRPRVFLPRVFNTNTYIDSYCFRNYLTVSPDEGFSIASVWFNQSQDSHPPLYFLLYHALSCLEMGTFSKWTGITINLFFLICSSICIFMTARKLTGYTWAGLVATALWGFSAEAVSYTLCARMYMMSAFFVVLFVYQSFSFFEPLKENDWKDCLCLLLATTGGCLTHYYFYIAAFAMAAVNCIVLWIEKGFRKVCKYGFSVLGGVFLSWAIYPQIFYSLAHGDGRGREAVRNLKDLRSLWYRIGLLVEQIEIKLLYKPVFAIVLFASSLIVVTVILRILWKKQVDPELKSRVSMLLTTELTFVLYMLAVAKLQPFYTNRYYFPITVLLWIVVFGNVIILARILSIRFSGETIRKTVSIVLIVLVMTATGGIIKGHVDQKVMFLYPRQERIVEQIQQMGKPPALYIIRGNIYTLTAHCVELANCSEVLCVDINTEADLLQYDIHDESDSMVVFAGSEFDQQKLVDQILEQTAYDAYELIGRGSGIGWEDQEENYIYCFSK